MQPVYSRHERKSIEHATSIQQELGVEHATCIQQTREKALNMPPVHSRNWAEGLM